MTKLNVKEYLEDEVYKKSEYLTQPDGTKICVFCNAKRFTREFYSTEIEEFPDGKVPVCTDCWKKRHDGEDIIKDYNLLRVCRKCEQKKNIIEYTTDTRNNSLGYCCNSCLRRVTKRGT